MQAEQISLENYEWWEIKIIWVLRIKEADLAWLFCQNFHMHSQDILLGGWIYENHGKAIFYGSYILYNDVNST